MAILLTSRSIGEYANAVYEVTYSCKQCGKKMGSTVVPMHHLKATGELSRITEEKRRLLNILDFCSPKCDLLFQEQEYEKAEVNKTLTQMLEGKL